MKNKEGSKQFAMVELPMLEEPEEAVSASLRAWMTQHSAFETSYTETSGLALTANRLEVFVSENKPFRY